MPAVATTIYKVRAISDFLAQNDDQVSFRKGQAFYVLSSNPDTGFYFVSTQYATPFSRTSVSGLVPMRNFEVVDLMSKDSAPAKNTSDKSKEKERKDRERREAERERIEKERQLQLQKRERNNDLDEWDKRARQPIYDHDEKARFENKFPRPFGAPRAPSEEDLHRYSNSKIDFRRPPDSMKRRDIQSTSMSSEVSESTNSSPQSKGKGPSTQSSNGNNADSSRKQADEQIRKLNKIRLEQQEKQKQKQMMQKAGRIIGTSSLDRDFTTLKKEHVPFDPPPALRGLIDLNDWDLLVNDRVATVEVMGVLEKTSRHPSRVRMRVMRQTCTHIVDRTLDDLVFLHQCLVREFMDPSARGTIPLLPGSLAPNSKLFQHLNDISNYIARICSMPGYILDSMSIKRFFAPINEAEADIIGDGISNYADTGSSPTERTRDSWKVTGDKLTRKQRGLSRSSSVSSFSLDRSGAYSQSSLQRPLGHSQSLRKTRTDSLFSKEPLSSYRQSIQKRLNSAGDAEETAIPLTSNSSLYVNPGSVYQPSHESRRFSFATRKNERAIEKTPKSVEKSGSPYNQSSESDEQPPRGSGAPALPRESSPNDPASPAPILSPPPTIRRFSKHGLLSPVDGTLIPQRRQSRFPQKGDQNTYVPTSKEQRQVDPDDEPQNIRRILAARIAAAAAAKQSVNDNLEKSHSQRAQKQAEYNGYKDSISRSNSMDEGSRSYNSGYTSVRSQKPNVNSQNDDYGKSKPAPTRRPSMGRMNQMSNYPKSNTHNRRLSSSGGYGFIAPINAVISPPASNSNSGSQFGTMNSSSVRQALLQRQQQALETAERAASIQSERERDREKKLTLLARQQLQQQSREPLYDEQYNTHRRSESEPAEQQNYRSPSSPSRSTTPTKQLKSLSRSYSSATSKPSTTNENNLYSNSTSPKNTSSNRSFNRERDSLEESENLNTKIPTFTNSNGREILRKESLSRAPPTTAKKALPMTEGGATLKAGPSGYQKITDFGARGSSLRNKERGTTNKIPNGLR